MHFASLQVGATGTPCGEIPTQVHFARRMGERTGRSADIDRLEEGTALPTQGQLSSIDYIDSAYCFHELIDPFSLSNLFLGLKSFRKFIVIVCHISHLLYWIGT